MFLFTLASAVLLLSSSARWGATLDVIFLNVGHGDAILVDCGTWECLIDTGYAEYWRDSSPRTAILDSYVNRPIEVFLLSHPDRDHYGGFAFLRSRYGFGEVWRSPDTADEETGKDFLSQLNSAGAPLPVRTLAWSPGAVSLPPEGLSWEVLHPPASTSGGDDNRSLVVKLTYGQVVFLFTGDIDSSAETQIMKRFSNGIAPEGDYVILKLPQHGAANEKLADFLRWSGLDVAVCSSDTTCCDAAADLRLLRVPLYVTHASLGVYVHTDGTRMGTEIRSIP